MSVGIAQHKATVFKDDLTPLTPSRYKILVPVANPATADDLLDVATSLAHDHKGEVVALHILVSANGRPADDEIRSASARRTILEGVVTSRRRSSVPIHTVTRIAHTPAQGITETAGGEDGYDLMLLGWQGHMRPITLGSSLGEVLDPVVREAPCPVAVVKNPNISQIQHILVPTAGGPNSTLALSLAMTLARRHKADITLLNIAKKGHEEAGRRTLERALQQAHSPTGVKQQVVVADHVVKGILKEAKTYDVVILGASQEGVFQQILFGIVPEQVAKRCAKMVIMVKGTPGPLVSGLRRLWSTWSSVASPRSGAAVEAKPAAEVKPAARTSKRAK